MTFVIPEMDVLLRAFSRQDPDPLAVRQLGDLVRARRVLLVGWVRQGLLTRCTDERQFQRLVAALAPFPDLPIRPSDHVAAAQLTRELRQRSGSIQPAQSLLWIMAERCGARIWTRESRWSALERLGAPLFREDGPTPGTSRIVAASAGAGG